MLRGRIPQGTRRKPKPPLDWELHLNPISLGIAAFGGALAMWWLGLGVRVLTPQDIANLEKSKKQGEKWLADLLECRALLVSRIADCKEACVNLPTADLILECRNRCDELTQPCATEFPSPLPGIFPPIDVVPDFTLAEYDFFITEAQKALGKIGRRLGLPAEIENRPRLSDWKPI